jgi:hypothetical protein
MLQIHAPINSCNNGILLFAHVYLAFDKYLIAVNPGVSHFTISFLEVERTDVILEKRLIQLTRCKDLLQFDHKGLEDIIK